MFIYSLTGLELKDAGQEAVEIEESETTARSAVYQVLGQLFATPDTEHYEKARDGQWAKELTEAGTLLTFPFEVGEARITEDVAKDAYEGEYASVFAESGAAPIRAGAYFEDAARNIEEVVRFFEYYGLQAGGGDLPPDHLATECDFLQFLAFKEAAAPSDRLRKSFQRAQLDFYDRQFGIWVPKFAAAVSAAEPSGFFGWAAGTVAQFAQADREYVAGLLGV